MGIQGWFPLGLTGLISMETSRTEKHKEKKSLEYIRSVEQLQKE